MKQLISDEEMEASIGYQQWKRRRRIRSIAAQTILQCATFAGAILVYHFVGMPQLVQQAFQDGQASGWRNAVGQTCSDQSNQPGG